MPEVKKNDRKETQFEVIHHYYHMRKEVTDLLLFDFGYSHERAVKRVEKQFGKRSRDELTEDEQVRYDKILKRLQAYYNWFITDEREAITNMLRNIGRCIFAANDGIPQYWAELVQRRILQDEALGWCDALKQEIQYAIETLPVDVNKYIRFSDMIEREIKLIKKWRSSDNRFKKTVKKTPDDYLGLHLIPRRTSATATTTAMPTTTARPTRMAFALILMVCILPVEHAHQRKETQSYLMENKINTSYDGTGYDHAPCEHSIISDANNLYEAWLRAKSGSDWKGKVQMFEMDWLHQISLLQKEIDNRTYKPSQPTEFLIRERGKERLIHGEQIRDRVLEHSLNDNVVIPSIRPYLIYDNGASLEGKGIGFTRKRLVQHLVRYYNKYGNEGYVLLIDFSKYYDNIRHKELMDLFRKYITDETALWLLETIINEFRVDVSYMTEEEYECCMDTLFNSLQYQHISPELKTGEKFMDKHLDIGNQTSQSAGILYPTPLDNYIKIVRSVEFYARYMDDSYILHPDKEYLHELLKDIIQYAASIGITINENKTQIVPISSYWRFLQVQYSLTETGRIVQKINPKRVTKMRQKMKTVAPLLPEEEFKIWVLAWLKSQRKLLSHKQHSNILHLLYNLLKGEELCTSYA